jgi:7,8-dihydroneopterin aldolase/epimerase/oxygenase
VKVELRGLELHGYHGVLPEERERGQRFLVDVRFEPADSQASTSDDIAAAVDYRDAVAVVGEVFDGRAFHLLEALATSLAEALLERLPLAWVEVTVRKPDVALERPVEHAAVTVERYAATASE